MAAHMVSGVCRSEHITQVLKDLHWLPVSQRIIFKTALMVSLQIISATSAYPLLPSQVDSICICSNWHSTGSTCLDCYWTVKFHSQWTSHMEPSATSTTVTRPGVLFTKGRTPEILPTLGVHSTDAGVLYSQNASCVRWAQILAQLRRKLTQWSQMSYEERRRSLTK